MAATAYPAFATGAQPAAAGVVRFEIRRFDVTGNTLLPQAAVDAALVPYTGKGRDFGDVQRAIEALESAYHRRGYKPVLVTLPEQELDRGVVKLVVVQTRIGRVKVSGNTVFDEANIRRSLPGLVEGQTPNIHKISSQLRLANESPSKKVTLALKAGELDDEVDATLAVEDTRAWKAMFSADNSGTGTTGRTLLGAGLQHANLFGRDHVASIQYTTTAEHPDQVAVYGLGYHIPLYTLGDSIDLYASYSDVDSGVVTAGIFDLAVSGRGSVAGLRYNQLLARRDQLDQRFVYGIDYKAYKNSVLFADTDFGSDVTVHPLSVGYMASKPTTAGELAFAATWLRNIPGGSEGGEDAFTAARVGADPDYQMLRLAGSYTHQLENGWQPRLLLNAQLTGDALIPGEQFGAGGATSVRGFDERQVASDSGASANLELFTPELCRGKWQCRALAFYDTAYARRNHALAGEMRSTTIASTGLGVRIAFSDAMNLQLDWGHIVRDGELPATDKNRVHVRMGIAY